MKFSKSILEDDLVKLEENMLHFIPFQKWAKRVKHKQTNKVLIFVIFFALSDLLVSYSQLEFYKYTERERDSQNFAVKQNGKCFKKTYLDVFGFHFIFW